MYRTVVALLFIVSCLGLHAQDYLKVPSTNPQLFYLQNEGVNGEKVQVQEDSVIYTYDTLSLPFIDDFSTDRFPRRIESNAELNNLKDTIIYRILINNVPDRDTFGYVLDTTYIYTVDGDSITDTIPNQHFTLQLANIKLFPTEYTVVPRVYPAYDIFDTINKGDRFVKREPDYLSDSSRYYFALANKNDLYTDRSVYRNTTFPLNPPTIGVATFDGLDQFGLPYDIENPRTIQADQLTSKPINLGNLPNQNVFFSFYYQPKGLSIDAPEREDSLVLEFYNVRAKKWKNVWDTTGFESDTFIQQIVQVPNDFFHNGFQFRFKNYANSSGAFDQWHIDYIYLNHSRSINDKIYNDIAYIYDAPSMLKDYTAMPWFHFQADPSSYLVDTLRTFVVNASDESKSVFNKVQIPDTVSNTLRYQYPANNNDFVNFPAFRKVDFVYPLDQSIYLPTDIDTAGVFKATFDIDFRPSPSDDKDLIRSNDTVIGKAVLKNYYAYDDGTAEAGYGINPQGGSAYMAVKFEIPFQDTIGGISLYFLPQEVDIRNQNMELLVWNNNLGPANLTFTKAIKVKPVYSDDNAFLSYFFDSLIIVNKTFYVGLRGIGPRSLNIGYDLNRNNRDKVFWSFNGQTWSNPSNGIQDGSLMLRPIFRKKNFGVGMTEVKSMSRNYQIKLFPNPTTDELNILLPPKERYDQMHVMDINGKLVYDGVYQSKLDVSGLTDGLYFIRLINREGDLKTKKFLIAR